MKQRCIAFIMALLLFVGFACVPAAAATEQDTRPNMEDIKSRYEEMEKNFDSLTDKQKEQIYQMNAEVLSQMEKLIQKYVELGVFTQDEADKMIDHITRLNDNAQKDGNIVGIPIPRGDRITQKQPK